MSDIDTASNHAIRFAKARHAKEVTGDDLLLGCLLAVSRFGVAQIGPWNFDLEVLGINWQVLLECPESKICYSDSVVRIFDEAAKIARMDGSATVRIEHLFIALGQNEGSLMSRLKSEFRIESATWRAAIAEWAQKTRFPSVEKAKPTLDGYLTPEEAAEVLSIHVQTLRGYVRSGKLPALRLAGERALRIRRLDLEKVFEPLIPEKS